MNEIVITGSTGVIGRRAVRELLAAGHRVTGVTRSARGRERLESLGARAVEADVFDEASLRRAFDGADAVVNLLTHVPSADRMADPSAWEENDRVRTEASAAIARAAQAAGVQRLVQESIAFVYADGGDAWLDEDAPVAGGGVTTTALTAERNARELFDGDTVVLRFGLFMGPDSGSTQAALEAARGGASIAIGPPGAYRPTLWLDDAAAAIAAALRAPAGTYNVADADPPTNAEIDAALAAAVGVAGPAPAGAAGRAAGALAARVEPPAARGERLGAAHARGHGDLGPDRRMTAAERFAQARPRLLRLAYSELGDVGEAEDVVQEAWLRLERADAEAIENLDGWLTTVVARLALDRLRSARARRETYVGPWLPEPLVSDDPADRVTLDESVSYALLTVLEQLSPAERTAFVLHDVFDVPFGDVAEVVGRTPEAVRQLASRARRHVKRERPRFAASRDEHDRAVRAFAQAVAEGNLEGLVAVLDPDVVWTSDGGGRATAARKPLRGGARVARAWAAFSRRADARTDRDRAQRAARAGAPEQRRPSRGALVRRQRRSHHAHRRGPQPGEAAAPLNEFPLDHSLCVAVETGK